MRKITVVNFNKKTASTEGFEVTVYSYVMQKQVCYENKLFNMKDMPQLSHTFTFLINVTGYL